MRAMTGYAAAKVATIVVSQRLGREVRFSGPAMYTRMKKGAVVTVEVDGQMLVDGDAFGAWLKEWCDRAEKRTSGKTDYEAVAAAYAE